MRIVIESTDQLLTLDGVDGRIWQGIVEGGEGDGTEVLVFVHRVLVPTDSPQRAFEQHLGQEVAPPTSIETRPADDGQR